MIGALFTWHKICILDIALRRNRKLWQFGLILKQLLFPLNTNRTGYLSGCYMMAIVTLTLTGEGEGVKKKEGGREGEKLLCMQCNQQAPGPESGNYQVAGESQ